MNVKTLIIHDFSMRKHIRDTIFLSISASVYTPTVFQESQFPVATHAPLGASRVGDRRAMHPAQYPCCPLVCNLSRHFLLGFKLPNEGSAFITQTPTRWPPLPHPQYREGARWRAGGQEAIWWEQGKPASGWVLEWPGQLERVCDLWYVSSPQTGLRSNLVVDVQKPARARHAVTAWWGSIISADVYSIYTDGGLSHVQFQWPANICGGGLIFKWWCGSVVHSRLQWTCVSYFAVIVACDMHVSHTVWHCSPCFHILYISRCCVSVIITSYLN